MLTSERKSVWYAMRNWYKGIAITQDRAVPLVVLMWSKIDNYEDILFPPHMSLKNRDEVMTW